MPFKKDFVFGVASAAYQIEGAYNEGGRGELNPERVKFCSGLIKSMKKRYNNQKANISLQITV